MKGEIDKVIEELTEALELLDYGGNERITRAKAIIENCIDELREEKL